MGFYDAFKDALNLAQKADNVELYRQLLDLSAQALDLQAENAKLKEENTELRKKKDLADRIVRHKEPVITLKNEKPILYYCSHCYDNENKLIQVRCDFEYGEFLCPHCNMSGEFPNAETNEAKSMADDGFSSFISYNPYGL